MAIKTKELDQALQDAEALSPAATQDPHALIAQLRHTRFLLQQIAGATQDSVVMLDRELRVLYASRSMNGKTVDAMAGKAVTNIFPASFCERGLPVFRRVLDSGQADRFSLRLAPTSGDERQFDIRVLPAVRAGNIIALTLIATETSEQLRAERAIALQARMIESMLEGVAVLNEAHIIEMTNPAFDEMFAYRRGELIGHDFRLLPARPVAALASAPAAGSAPTSLQLEFDAQRKDGSVFAIAGVLSRFESAGRHQSLVVLENVSERKQLERAILQAVNREQYRIGNDLHDGLGQELTGIALMLRGVAGRLQAEYPALLPEIDGITRLVSNAIESTRALARGLSPVDLERGGLKDALKSLAMHTTGLYGTEVSFAYRANSSKLLAPELANHLYRIAQEAVRNAVRHGHARFIRLYLCVSRGKVRLVISDDGGGLPANAMEAPGMGLKIMRYRARMASGEIRFEATQPQGTRVICECPLELLQMPNVHTPPKRPRPAGKRGTRSGKQA